MAQGTYEMKVDFNFEQLPELPTELKNLVIADYVNGRQEVVDIFNKKIGEINEAWSKTGKPAMFGEYMEDINPEYTKFVNSFFDDDIAEINKHHYVKCYMDEYSDIAGTLPDFKGSKIYATLSPL